MISCVDDAPLSPGHGATAQLALLASITGLSAEGDYTVHVIITSANSEGLTDLPIEPDFFALSADAATVQPITVDLSSCPEGCQLSAVLTLSDDVGDLATDTVDLGLVHQGDQVTPADTVKLVPRYELTIDGGGEGTGSGTVVIAAIGGVPAVQCEITNGSPAETGCSARYPIHTVVTLVATVPRGTTLESWAGDCAAAAPDAACELIMDGRRTARARFGLPPTTGDLEIQLAGLPTGAQAQVTVVNTRGFSRQLTESAVLTSLEPGDYTVSAEPVVAEDLTYSPDPATQSISIVAGERAIAQIGYNPPTTGSLAVTITGLPNDVAAQVTVAGPGFPNPQQVTTGSTFAGLPPGNYTVTAGSVTALAGQPYDPSVTPAQPVAVAAGRGSTVTVAYSVPPAARLVFTRQPGAVVSGVPISPAVTVEVRDAQKRPAPGFTSQVTLSLRGGTAGATLGGTVAAIPLRGVATFSGLTVDLVGTGYLLSASAQLLPTVESVTFTVVPGPISPSRSSVEISRTALRTCCDTAVVMVTARDAAGNPVSGATVALSATGAQNVLLNPVSTTDSNGVALGRFASRTIGTKTVSAAINGIGLTRGVAVEVQAGVVFDRLLVFGQIIERDLYVMNPDGSDTVNITRDLASQADPAWLPDGSRIAFTVNGSIYSMSADGSDTVNLTGRLGGRASAPAWSPDGSTIAFGFDICGECGDELYLIDRDGSKPFNVTIDSGGTSPSWSPDGGRIAFVRESCGESCRSDIWVIRRDGNQAVRLTGDLAGNASSPAWSPDGLKIVFALEQCDTFCVKDLYTMSSADGSNPVNLTNRRLGRVGSAAWSPDATRVLVTIECTQDGPCNDELVLMGANGESPRRIALGANADWR